MFKVREKQFYAGEKQFITKIYCVLVVRTPRIRLNLIINQTIILFTDLIFFDKKLTGFRKPVKHIRTTPAKYFCHICVLCISLTFTLYWLAMASGIPFVFLFETACICWLPILTVNRLVILPYLVISN